MLSTRDDSYQYDLTGLEPIRGGVKYFQDGFEHYTITKSLR